MIKDVLHTDSLLGDKEIRASLIHRLQKSIRHPKRIIEELRVHNGNAIADVVSIHNYAHCYEIKSDKDSIERAVKQSYYYDLAFRKVTLVTTSRHLDKAINKLPPYWGIIVAKTVNNRIVLSYFRSAAPSPNFDKRLALLTLWKSELTDVALPISDTNLVKLSRAKLSTLIADKFNAKQLALHIGTQLVLRNFRS